MVKLTRTLGEVRLLRVLVRTLRPGLYKKTYSFAHRYSRYCERWYSFWSDFSSTVSPPVSTLLTSHSTDLESGDVRSQYPQRKREREEHQSKGGNVDRVLRTIGIQSTFLSERVTHRCVTRIA